MPCLTDLTLYSFLAGDLDEASTNAVELEIDRCDSCRELLATIIKTRRDGDVLQRGALVGRYEIDELVGRGAMGEVYRARDPDVDRVVALKLIRGPIGTDQDKLLREAQAMGRLRHPNVVQVYDLGSTNEFAYVVMEYIDGPDLRSWLAAEKRSWRQVAAVFEQTAAGLAAAHAKGIIHRDFKPANVVLDREGRAHVADFGLAQLGESRVPTSAIPEMDDQLLRVSRTGSVVGTPAYMAPELFEGTESNAHSDQFSFAVALYEALYGHRPFAGDTLKELLVNMQRGTVIPPIARQAPAWLSRVALRGLQTDPDKRWPSMESMRNELVPKRRLWPMVAAGAVVLALGTSAAVYALDDEKPTCNAGRGLMQEVWNEKAQSSLRAAVSNRFPGNDSVAAAVHAMAQSYSQAWSAAHDTACRETRIDKTYSRQTLDSRMACLQHKRVAFRSTLARLRSSDEAAARSLEAIRDVPNLEECTNVAALSELVPLPDDMATATEVEAVRVGLAEQAAALSAGEYTEGVEQAGVWLARAQETAYKPLIAEAYESKGSLEHAAGLHVEAEASLKAALLAAAAGRHRYREASAHWQLADLIGYTLARYQEGKSHAELALAVLAAIGGNDLLSAHVHQSLGIIESELGENASALEHYEQALTRYETIYGRDTLESARTLENMAMVLLDLGRHEDAEPLYARARKIVASTLGDNHPAAADSASNYSTYLLETGKAKEALEVAGSAHEVRVRLLGPEHPDVAKSAHNLGSLLEHLGDYEGARVRLQEAIDAKTAAFGATHTSTAMSLHALGVATMRLKRANEAIPSLKKAEAIFIEQVGEAHLYVATARSALGEAYLAVDDFPNALRALELAAASRDPKDLAQPSLLAERFNLALALWHGKTDRNRAVTLVRSCLQLAEQSNNDGYTQYFNNWLSENAAAWPDEPQ